MTALVSMTDAGYEAFVADSIPDYAADKVAAGQWSEADALDLAGIALHVFGGNVAARALYRKLGHTPTNITLYKPILR